MVQLSVDPHPLLEVRAFVTTFSKPLGESPSSDALRAGLKLDAPAPVKSSDDLRGSVGTCCGMAANRPAAGSPRANLIRASTEGQLGTINLAVGRQRDVPALGLTISVVDLDLAKTPFRIGVAREGDRMFHASGQDDRSRGAAVSVRRGWPVRERGEGRAADEDPRGDHADAVGDLGTKAAPDQAGKASAWYQELLRAQGAVTEDVGSRWR